MTLRRCQKEAMTNYRNILCSHLVTNNQQIQEAITWNNMYNNQAKHIKKQNKKNISFPIPFPRTFSKQTVSFPLFWSGCSRFTKRLKACRRALREDPASASSRWTFSKISAAGLPGGASCSPAVVFFSKTTRKRWSFWMDRAPVNAATNHSWCDGYNISNRS